VPDNSSDFSTDPKPNFDGDASKNVAEKMQLWKKFWPPKAESLVSEDRSGSVTPPWADLEPDPKNPDEKPWIQWMNNTNDIKHSFLLITLKCGVENQKKTRGL